MPSPAITRLEAGITSPEIAQLRRVSHSAVDPSSSVPVSKSQELKFPKLTGIEASKQLAAYTAVDRHISPNHRVRRLAA